MPKQLQICVLVLVALQFALIVSAETQIRKPTNANDMDQVTSNPKYAFDFPDVYNENTSAETVEPEGNASINWTAWNTTDVKSYEKLSISVTANSSGFLTTSWGIFFDNSSDTVCNSLDRPIRELSSDNPASKENFTAVLPRDQDLSRLEVCVVSDTSASLDSGQTIDTWDIRTNGTVDTAAPLWRNQQQNTSLIAKGEAVELSAQGKDRVNLSHAVLSTNETGVWKNRTENYSSPMMLYAENRWTWSNFTWDNESMAVGSTVGWRIWYNDTNGNYNVTDTSVFSSRLPMLNVTLVSPPSPFTATQNQTFALNATVSCLYGDCGSVSGNASYNRSSAKPDTTIPQSSGKPFHTAGKSNPITCDTDLLRDETCNVTWEINATGADSSIWSIDVNFTSDLNTVQWKDTADAEVEIVAFAIEIMLRWNTIDFSTLFVGTNDNPAENNTDNAYNITVTDGSTENVDIWANMTDLFQEDGDNTIGVSNMSVSTQNDPETANPLSHSFSLLQSNIAPGENVTTYYWMDTPLGIFADNYTGVLWVKANETA